MYKDITWSVPNENNEGYITVQESNKVLGIDKENRVGSKVMLQTKESPENLDQKWRRVSTDEGFFALRNLKSGLFLNNGQTSSFPDEFPTIESTFLFRIS
jgi:hypothetical protein